jgi:hypothetical protein
VVCKNKEEALSDEQATTQAKHPNTHCNVGHQIKMAWVAGIHSQVEKQFLESIIMQINVMRENEQMYKSIYNEVKYHQMIVNLMNKMPGMGMVDATGLVSTKLDGEDNEVETFENSK